MVKSNFQIFYVFVCLSALGTLSCGNPTKLQSSVILARQPTNGSISDCLVKAGVNGLTSASSSWGAEISPYNLRLPYGPAAVALPTTPAQVAAALKCAKAFSLKVQARGGGHSYASMSLGGKDGSLVIDMNGFNKIVVDQGTYIAQVGSGVRLGNMALAIYQQGGRALPHGTCAGVGIGGHATHGGFGFTSRMWGMTLDTIVKLDVVLANGTITTATSTVNSELFWALKGAGSSFAIVTSFYFQTVAAPASGLLFTANLPGGATETAAQRASILSAMQKYGEDAPKEVALQLVTGTGSSFEVSGVYWGTTGEFQTAIDPFKQLLPSGTTFSTTESSYMGILVNLSGQSTLQVTLTGYNAHDTFFAKSIVSSQQYNSSALTPFFDYLLTEGVQVAGLSWFVIADLYGGKASKINTVPLGSASYAHRDALITYQLYSYSPNSSPPYPVNGIQFTNDMVASMTDYMDPEDVKGYVNYIDPTLTAAQAHQFYYGNDKWDGTPGPGEGRTDRLVRIKKAVDPDMTIWNPQAIGA